jgi:outer membrane protein OmpA-like peptidoglycan-associated protein
VAEVYTWNHARDAGTYRLPGPDHLGRWAAAAMVVSLLLHVAVFVVLDHYKIGLSIAEAREITTAPIQVQQVEVRPLEPEHRLEPETEVMPPKDAAALLEEVDLLAKLPLDQDIDIRPDVLEPEYALRMSNPAQEGAPAEVAPDRSAGMEIEAELPAMGRVEESLPPAAVGQITVDPGAVQADDLDLNKFTEDLLKKGAHGKVKEGALDGVTSLDDLIGLPANVLVNKKTMLPSDLLFDFNSTELRESAKVGLMKLGLLIDRNPKLYCWIEGHTDLVGGDEFNLKLSRQRAEAVRNYLVASLRMDGDKIVTRGKGKFEPLVASGSVEEQAANRRVEIRMRKNLPPPEPVRAAPPPAVGTPELPLLVVPRAEPVAPRAEPVAPRAEPVAPRAEPVAPRAEPVAPRAEPVAPRAEPVAPRAEPVAPRAEPVAPRAEPVAPRAEPVAPRAEPVEYPRAG